MATNGGVGTLLERAGAMLARIARGVRWGVVDMPPLAWTWLVSNAARVVAVVWIGGLGVFVTVASLRTYDTLVAEAKVERAREGKRAKQRKVIGSLEFMDIDEMHAQNDKRLARYGKEFQSMLPDAGPPGLKPKKKGGGIGGWIKRNKKHRHAKISDLETLRLLRKEMGAEFGALEEVAMDGDKGGVKGTLHRMKMISKLRGGKGSRVPSKELVAEMSGLGFDSDLMGTAMRRDGGSKPSDGEQSAGKPATEGVNENAGDAEDAGAGTSETRKPAPEAPAESTPTITSKRFDIDAIGDAAIGAFGSALEAAAANDGKANDGKASDGKASDGKASDGKANDGKASDGKENDGKASDGKASGGK